VISFFFLLISIFFWVYDVIIESDFGRYNNKIHKALIFGFVLFLLSELMVFSGFFWVLFDRLFFLPNVYNSFNFNLLTLERLVWYREPLIGTLLLVTSGYFANLSYYSAKVKNREMVDIFQIIAIILGLLFLRIQCSEYFELNINISDNVFTSIFFLLTGFHGLHVIIGIGLLTLTLLDKYHFTFHIDNEIDWVTMIDEGIMDPNMFDTYSENQSVTNIKTRLFSFLNIMNVTFKTRFAVGRLNEFLSKYPLYHSFLREYRSFYRILEQDLRIRNGGRKRFYYTKYRYRIAGFILDVIESIRKFKNKIKAKIDDYNSKK